MNYLELCQRLLKETNDNGATMTSVVGQSGEIGRIASWIITADEDVQRLHNEWRFMTGSFTLDTVLGDNSYAPADCIVPITDLRDWKRETLKMYSTGVNDEWRLCFIDYQDWYDTYNTGTQTNQRPRNFTIGNDQSLKLGPAPNGIFRVSGEYHKSVKSMAANSDTPSYPSEFHMLPVYLGMMNYGIKTGSSEYYTDGENRYKRMLAQMERTQLPRINIAGPLA